MTLGICRREVAPHGVPGKGQPWYPMVHLPLLKRPKEEGLGIVRPRPPGNGGSPIIIVVGNDGNNNVDVDNGGVGGQVIRSNFGRELSPHPCMSSAYTSQK